MSSQIDEKFADTLQRVDYINGLVRLEFASLEPPEKDGDKPKLASRHRMVLPMDGFLHTLSSLGGFVKKLEEQGVIKRNEGGDAKTADAKPKAPKAT